MLDLEIGKTASAALPAAVIEELRPPLTVDQVLIEADRCLECGGPEAEAPCVTACPADVDIPTFIGALARGHPDTAAATVFAENLLSGTCARVCPVELLCERACVLEHEGRRPVEIGRLHRHAADWGMEHERGWRRAASPRPWRVAVIGAGPTGLVCAGELAARGYSVSVYDAHDEPGGLVRYAIAPYRQLNDPLPAEARMVARLGAALHFGAEVASPEAMRRIEEEADAVVLAVGLGRDTDVSYPGDDLEGVWTSLRFIEEVKAGRLAGIAGSVAVIGGGNTAIDAARIARRLGADDVTLIYRRSESEMPAYPHEVAEASAEGVRFQWLAEPIRFLGAGRVDAIECRKTRLRSTGSGHRPRPEPVPGSEFLVFADTVVKAIGQQPRGELLDWVDGLVFRDGRLEVDPESGQTGNPKYFAGGDVTSGGATVVQAVREGKLIARGIVAALER